MFIYYSVRNYFLLFLTLQLVQSSSEERLPPSPTMLFCHVQSSCTLAPLSPERQRDKPGRRRLLPRCPSLRILHILPNSTSDIKIRSCDIRYFSLSTMFPRPASLNKQPASFLLLSDKLSVYLFVFLSGTRSVHVVMNSSLSM